MKSDSIYIAMRLSRLIILSAVITLSVTASFAATKDIPPWMEQIDDSGRSSYLVPKGAKRRIVGSQVLVEPPNEYVARRLYELEGYLERRFNEIEADQEQLKEDLTQIKDLIDDLNEADKATQMEHLNTTIADLEVRFNELNAAVESLRPEEDTVETDTTDLIGAVEPEPETEEAR